MPTPKLLPSRRRRLGVAGLAAAVALGASLLGAAPATAATTRPHLTISGSHSLINGDKRTFSIAGPTQARGAVVRLQKATGKTWTTLVSTKANSKGDAKFKLRVTGVGAIKYRATISKTKRYKAAKTNTVGLSLRKWFYLSDMDRVAAGPIGSNTGSATIAGRAYLHSVIVFFADEWWNDGYAEYNLGYHCSKFAATVGIRDSVKVPVPATNTVSVDGASIGTYSTATGQATAVDLDVTGAFRIKLDSAWDHSASKAYASGSVGWGNAAVLCSANPSPAD